MMPCWSGQWRSKMAVGFISMIIFSPIYCQFLDFDVQSYEKLSVFEVIFLLFS